MNPFNRGRLVLVALVTLLLVVAGAAAGAAGPVGTSAIPDGYQKFLVYLANGVYNPNDPNYTAPDGMFFQKQIMHRTDAQIAQEQAKALAFFNQRSASILPTATSASVCSCSIRAITIARTWSAARPSRAAAGSSATGAGTRP